MTLALIVAVWFGALTTLLLFQIYGPARKPRWLTWLELSPDVLTSSSWQLFILSALGLFLELLMIRWISSEITVFAYFKNFVLIACFLGFGLGAYLCRQPINLMALVVPLVYFAALIKLPWPALRWMVKSITLLLGSSTEVDIWGVPHFTSTPGAITGLALTTLFIIPLFSMLSMMFIPVGQAVARAIEESRDGVKAYSINILGSLAGVVLYTGLCMIFQPPAIWFLVAGVMLVAAFRASRARLAAAGTVVICALAASLPETSNSVREMLPESLGVSAGRTEWSPYQKLHWAATTKGNEVVAYQLMTNDSWYQYVVNLSDGFIRSHADLFQGVPPEANAYNMPYHFAPHPESVLVLGSGMGNDVAAALRNGARRVTAVEIDPLIIALGKRLHPERPYSDSRVSIINNDARSYMENARDRFELITFSLLDSHTTSSHYSNIRIDNYVYTREALAAARKLLRPDGIMVVKFQIGKPFIAGRLQATLTEVFGAPPVAFGVDKSFNISPGTFFVSGNRDRIATALQQPFLIDHLAKHGNVKMEQAQVTTDDWPFFYQHAPGLPSSVILISCVLILLCWQVMKKAAVPVSEISWPFFFLGFGFMLMESQTVSRMALLFGTTWLVNAITISGLLLLIVCANLLEHAGIRLPSSAAYAALVLTLLGAYFVPTSALFFDSLALKIGAAVAVWCSPVFFASIIFIRTFAAARFTGSALGSNLLGSLAGGLIESLSLWLGLRALLLLAIMVYLLAYWSQRRAAAPVAIEAAPSAAPNFG